MLTRLHLSRRQALLGGAATALGAISAGLMPREALARADMLGTAIPRFSRARLGKFEVTTLLAGTRTVPKPHDIFGTNASDADFQAAADAARIPADRAQFFFTPTVVNTGDALVLFDTGTDPGGLTAALTAAGYAPDQVDIVVLTHMHPDHIGGLMTDGQPTFAKARYVTGATEFDFWAKQDNKLFDANVKPLAAQTTMIGDNDAVVPGITGIDAFGHTPGHMAFHIESDGQRLLVTADTANHYVWSLAHPDWEVSFDASKADAAASRKKLFGMIAADRIPFIGYHMPFPALGYVEAAGDGFTYVPASYQLVMDAPA